MSDTDLEALAGHWKRFADRCAQEPDEFSTAYWDRLAQHPPLKPLGQRCHECPVFEGMYAPATFSLAKMPEATQEAVSDSWFCHVHTHRACAGNREFLTFLRARASLSRLSPPNEVKHV